MNRHIDRLIENTMDSKRAARANALIGGPWAKDIIRCVDALQESIQAYCVLESKRTKDLELLQELTK